MLCNLKELKSKDFNAFNFELQIKAKILKIFQCTRDSRFLVFVNFDILMKFKNCKDLRCDIFVSCVHTSIHVVEIWICEPILFETI